ncbi:MAG: hypothetical protein ACXQS5_04350 [Candidatus Methanospirareceae archaeon]
MELWEQAEKYRDRAIETEDIGRAIELYGEAISLYLQAAEVAETGEDRLTWTGDARMIEGVRYAALTNKLTNKAIASSGIKRAGYFRKAAGYLLSAYPPLKETAEIAKEHDDIASYQAMIGGAYQDCVLYHYCLAKASEAALNWDEVLSAYKESLPLFESAVEHFSESLRVEFDQEREYNRESCIAHIELCGHNIQKAESKTIGIKTTGTPSLSVDVTADNLGQDTYSPVMLRIVNDGDGVAKDVKIRLDAPVEGETTASLETMSEEYETGLALSVKPLPHGRMKFKIYAEYRDMQGRKDAAIGEAWLQVARLTEDPVGQQVFHIANFTGEIGWDKQVAGGGRTR